MNHQELYYIAPPQEAFDEMKAECIKLWQTYDDTHGYATEKVNRIKDVDNVRDNFMYIFAMFDHHNQAKVMNNLSDATVLEIENRLPQGYY